ncbi:hypothetical protein GCM10016455_18130 [Aliiroseovarius zhejiangensis]|uniref:Uncharacterized protein n=1 Tax=Aliiroseovarius zhejiangensis TaxID=1632025 RepID=A0ABQ3IXR2_9RHOB|nr:hypothetical protein [Aliiroseovarius zhejiangensis]GHE97885.1 hypothetical protein GCM10016455_18130 [Aliiroseovarius zhejiangensis]
MRISTVFQFLFSFALLAVGYLLITGGLSTNSLYDAYQRFSSGVVGWSAEASHNVTATASIAALDRSSYAGQLDATITFTDAGGTETVFDLHYPTDYNLFHDGFGPLWLANLRPDIANNPQVTPVLGNSCLQTINGENLAPSLRYRTGYKEYIVCRVLDEEGPDAPRSYDITQAKPAVIGLIWANRNHQPMDYPRERCVAEVRIWSTEIAKPGDRFMACVFVVSEEPHQVETYAFELNEDSIVEVGGASESWSRAAVETRAATRLVQYRLMQEWLADLQIHDAAVERAYAHVAANLDQVVPARASQFDGVERKNGVIIFTFRAKDTAEMFRIRDGSNDGADRHLYQHIRRLVCGSDERAALLAFQENAVTYIYELNSSDGRPMTLYGAFPNLPC